MTQTIAWDPTLRTGYEALDAQHQALVAQVNRLAELCRSGDDAGFDQALAQLKTLADEHFETESRLLPETLDDPDALESEREGYVFLMNEVATRSNFDAEELQRFLAVWWLGHIRGMAAEYAANAASGA